MDEIVKTSPKASMPFATVVVLSVLLGSLLALPSLWNGFLLDDFAHLSMIERWHPERANPFNLYSSALSEHILFPWWISQEVHISFWRPLTSASIRLDHGIFGRQPLLYHVHSVLWLAALIGACGLLYSRLPRRIAIPALVVFAVDEGHALTTGWIANRHTVIAATVALLGLWAHLRWRQEGWRPGLPLSVLGFGVGLLAGETALSVMAYAFAFELFAGPGKGLRRLSGLLSVGVLAGGYLLAYRAMGHGASGSAMYLDPLGEPVGFLFGAAGRIPAMLAGTFLAVPPDLWPLLPSVRPLQVALGVGAFLGLLALLRARWPELEPGERRALPWLLTGGILCLIPAVIPFPSDRQLLAPMIGLGGGIATLLGIAWRRWRAGWGERRWTRWAAGVLLLVLSVVHFAGAPLARLASQAGMKAFTRGLVDVVAQLPGADSGGERRHFIMVNAPDVFSSIYVPAVHDYYRRPGAMSWQVLSAAPHDHLLTRSGPRTLELAVLDGQMLATFFEQVLRPVGSQLVAGDVVRADLFEAEVMEANELGPTRVAFRFPWDLGDSRISLLVWQHDGVREVEIPEVGDSVKVPRVEVSNL